WRQRASRGLVAQRAIRIGRQAYARVMQLLEQFAGGHAMSPSSNSSPSEEVDEVDDVDEETGFNASHGRDELCMPFFLLPSSTSLRCMRAMAGAGAGGGGRVTPSPTGRPASRLSQSSASSEEGNKFVGGVMAWRASPAVPVATG